MTEKEYKTLVINKNLLIQDRKLEIENISCLNSQILEGKQNLLNQKERLEQINVGLNNWNNICY